MPRGDITDELERISVDGFTQLSQWDRAVLERDRVVLTHDEWPIDLLWERWRRPSAWTLDVDALKAVTTHKRGPEAHGQLFARGARAVIDGVSGRGNHAENLTLLGVLKFAMGWEPPTIARRTRSRELHDEFRRFARIAPSIDVSRRPNIALTVLPVEDRDGSPLGSVSALRNDGPMAPAAILSPATSDGTVGHWRVAYQSDFAAIIHAGWVATIADMGRAERAESNAEAISELLDIRPDAIKASRVDPQHVASAVAGRIPLKHLTQPERDLADALINAMIVERADTTNFGDVNRPGFRGHSEGCVTAGVAETI